MTKFKSIFRGIHRTSAKTEATGFMRKRRGRDRDQFAFRSFVEIGWNFSQVWGDLGHSDWPLDPPSFELVVLK